MPRDMVTVELQLASVLDLTSTNVQSEWGLDATALASDDFVACQEVGAAARRAGYEAIIYPSATGAGENLALFFDRLHPGSYALVADQKPIDPAALAGLDSS
jgi:RES domain-containing protein